MVNLDKEFSKQIPIDKVSVEPMSYTLTANVGACEAIAERLGIIAVDSVEAKVEIYKKPDLKAIYVEGHVKASVKQACILTGDPVSEEVQEDFESYFVANEEIVENLEEMDPAFVYEDVEVLEDDYVDVAELSIQYLSLSLNPYPKKENADVNQLQAKGFSLKTQEEHEEDVRKEKNPFSVLQGLKKD